MSTTVASSKPAASNRPEKRVGPFVELVQLSQQSASQNAFLQRALRCIAAALGARYAALYARLSAEAIEHSFCAAGEQEQFWKAPCSRFLTESLAEARARARVVSSRDGTLRVCLMFAPLFNLQAVPMGGVALAVPIEPHEDARPRAALLQSLAALCSYLGSGVSTPAAAGSATPNISLTKAASVESPEALAFSITSALRNKLGCELVALGLVRGRYVRMLSISGQHAIKHSSPGVTALRSAMEECLDAGNPLVSQRRAGWNDDELVSGHRLHEQWRQQSGGSVASIPLRDGQQTCAIISLSRNADEPFTRELIETVRKQVEPFAAALELLRRARRGVLTHAGDALRGAARCCLRREHFGSKVLIGAAVLGGLWFCLGNMPYEIRVPCSVQPARAWHAAAPFEAALLEVHVRDGDNVRAGELLCTLDARELELQRTAANAEVQLRRQQALQALAAEQRAEAQLAQAAERMLAARIALLDARIERAQLRAPFDGVVIAEKLAERVGNLLRQGEPILQVAPRDAWTLELELDQRHLNDIGTGLSGRFAAHARPDQPQPLTLTRLRPERAVREGRGVYLAEASLSGELSWLRPGMEGVAKVQIGPRRIAWVSLHRLVDFVRLNLWF